MTGQGISSIDDVKALEEIPLAARQLPRSVLAVIERGRAHCDGRDALIFMADATRPDNVRRWSYDDLIGAVDRAARGFFALAGDSDAVFAIILPNLPEMHFALWGAQSVGRACPINPLLEPSAIADILRATGAGFVVTLSPMPGPDLFEKVVAAARMAPSVTTVITVDPIPGSQAAGIAPSGLEIVRFTDLPQPGQDSEVPRRGGSDIGALFHTGGTTGSPKIAQLTHDNQIFTAWAANANRTMERSRTIFCGLPLFHVNGALVTGLVAWLTGATVLLGPSQGFRAPGLLENLWYIFQQYQVGAMSAVPTIYARLAEIPVADHDISHLEFCICGAAPMPVDMISRFEAVSGAPLLEGYGLTEGACMSTINPGYGDRRPGSVGLRAPYQRLAIVQDRGDGVWREVDPGTAGTVVLNGPNIFAGYLNPDDDAKAWIWIDGERWYDTGDLGRVDGDGYLWLTGRKKDLIIRGGHNIDPSIIEHAFSQHPDVRLVAAVGSPDRVLGEVPVAYVELIEGLSADAASLLAFAAGRIGERAAVPRRVVIVAAMPVTSIGKIYKPELKRREIEASIADQLRGRFGDAIKVAVRLDPRQGLLGMMTADAAMLDDSFRDVVAQLVAIHGVRLV